MPDQNTAERASQTDITVLNGSLAQRVYHSLRDAILSMTYTPGTVLRKGLICEQLSVSRSPVSEAIARLAAEGLVDVIPQSATKVSCFSMDEIREASFLREALELAAVAKVAASRTDDQVAQLARNLRLQHLLAEDDDFDGFHKADEEFHALLLDFTGFPGVASVASSVSLQLKRARMLMLPEPGRPEATIDEHIAILDAIRAKDQTAAQRAMKYHLGQLINRIEPLERQHPNFFCKR